MVRTLCRSRSRSTDANYVRDNDLLWYRIGVTHCHAARESQLTESDRMSYQRLTVWEESAGHEQFTEIGKLESGVR